MNEFVDSKDGKNEVRTDGENDGTNKGESCGIDGETVGITDG